MESTYSDSAPLVMLTVEEAARRLGIGRTMMYSLVMTGEVQSVRIGRLRRVPAVVLGEFVAKLIADSATPPAA